MKVAIFTNEFPPHIYGGAGVHVDYLAHALAKLTSVEVRAFGDQDLNEPNLRALGFESWDVLQRSTLPFKKVLQALSVNLAINNLPLDAKLVHCHTWYTFFAGFLAKLLYGVPLILTMHSLEPLRPWKAEQLDTGYALSSWIERYVVQNADKVIAVSAEMRTDVIKHYQIPEQKVVVIHNGIDPDEYQLTTERTYLDEQGIREPYLLFVGRISRQKGILQLLEAMELLKDLNLKLILCASAPDTPELEVAVGERVAANPHIKWLNQMVSKPNVRQLYSHARLFICPSVYEPFGIINLEAMACQAPVVASAVGGIKEVIINGETGVLVPPDNPAELAAAIRRVVNAPELLAHYRTAGRERVVKHFSWDSIARQTLDLYEQVTT